MSASVPAQWNSPSTTVSVQQSPSIPNEFDLPLEMLDPQRHTLNTHPDGTISTPFWMGERNLGMWEEYMQPVIFGVEGATPCAKDLREDLKFSPEERAENWAYHSILHALELDAALRQFQRDGPKRKVVNARIDAGDLGGSPSDGEEFFVYYPPSPGNEADEDARSSSGSSSSSATLYASEGFGSPLTRFSPEDDRFTPERCRTDHRNAAPVEATVGDSREGLLDALPMHSSVVEHSSPVPPRRSASMVRRAGSPSPPRRDALELERALPFRPLSRSILELGQSLGVQLDQSLVLAESVANTTTHGQQGEAAPAELKRKRSFRAWQAVKRVGQVGLAGWKGVRAIGASLRSLRDLA